ncbi:MAG: hypothetical protein ACO29V_13745 [Limnohabitans sp.]
MRVLEAWEQLQRIRRDQVALWELPVAQLTSLMANINRDSKKAPEPFALQDFALFKRISDDSNTFPVEAAAVALALRHEGKLPPVLVGVWPAVLAAAGKNTATPKVRALVSDDGNVALLAPKPEGKNWRGLLAVTSYPGGGAVRLRDIDKPLLSYVVELGPSDHFSFVASGELVMSRES